MNGITVPKGERSTPKTIPKTIDPIVSDTPVPGTVLFPSRLGRSPLSRGTGQANDGPLQTITQGQAQVRWEQLSGQLRCGHGVSPISSRPVLSCIVKEFPGAINRIRLSKCNLTGD